MRHDGISVSGLLVVWGCRGGKFCSAGRSMHHCKHAYVVIGEAPGAGLVRVRARNWSCAIPCAVVCTCECGVRRLVRRSQALARPVPARSPEGPMRIPQCAPALAAVPASTRRLGCPPAAISADGGCGGCRAAGSRSALDNGLAHHAEHAHADARAVADSELQS